MTTSELAVALVMCARCEARPGEKCRTVNGGRASYTHGARTKALYESWRDGFGEGVQHGLNLLRMYVERLQNSANLGDPYDQVLDRIKVVQAQYERNDR